VEELAYLSLGLGGETGEVLEKVKKYIRDGTFNRLDVAKEMGDVLWYLARLANAIGYDLDMIAKLNISKLSDRQKRNVLAGSGDER
jgi:NTP pyrophosphatase (non-canonical NTP hydrolase)